MELLIMFLIGVVVGILCLSFSWGMRLVGTLRVDNSDPDGSYLFLDLDRDLCDVWEHKYVFMKVDGGGKSSRK